MKTANLILLIVVMISCYPAKKQTDISPMGEMANVTLEGTIIYYGELISISDSSISLLSQGKIISLNLTDIKNIEIPGYSVEANQRIGAAIPSLVMQGFIFFIAQDIGEQTWANVTAISMAATIVLYATSGSNIEFSKPLSTDDIEQLRLYCRYPSKIEARPWYENVND